ncbi:MAG: hypothetical protein ACYDB5_09590 [bacterium]
MLGFIIFFIIFGSIFIFLGIALIRSVIIQKREHPYPYCFYPKRKTPWTSGIADDSLSLMDFCNVDGLDGD